MSSTEHTGSSGGGWLRRIADTLSGEPRDLEQLADVLADASERGLIDADVLEMLESVLQVSEIQVRDVMVPRSQMVVIQRDDPPEKILPVVIESGHSRFPVVGEDRDEVAGILLAKDMLRYFTEDGEQDFDIRECLRRAVFIPESKRLNVLLKEFRVQPQPHGHRGRRVRRRVRVADDRGRARADRRRHRRRIRRRRERGHPQGGRAHYSVPALTRIEDFNRRFGTRFSDDEFDTIGGLVLHELGRVPRRGEAIQIGGLELKVTRADRRQIETLRVTTPRDVDLRPKDGG